MLEYICMLFVITSFHLCVWKDLADPLTSGVFSAQDLPLTNQEKPASVQGVSGAPENFLEITLQIQIYRQAYIISL